MTRFRLIAAAIAALVMIPLFTAIAGNTQVNPSTYKAAGKTGHVYGRSDGVFQEENTKSPLVVENGQPVSWLGAGYRETFAYGDGKGLTQLDSGTGGTCAGNTTTVPCLAAFGGGVKLAWFPVVTATIELDMDADSLDIAGDQTDDDGTEIAGGVLGASGRPFIVGDDPAFYFCATLAVEDVSGTDDLQIGFRRAELFRAAFDDYLDAATFSIISGAINLETINDNAATTTTDTTQTITDAGAAKKYCVYVDAAGAVTYKIDSAAPTVTAAFSFDDGDPVIPFIRFLHAADLAGEIDLTLWEVGYSQ